MAAHKGNFVRKITAWMKKRLAVQSPQVLNNIATVLAMKGWEKSEDTSLSTVLLSVWLSDFKSHWKMPVLTVHSCNKSVLTFCRMGDAI